MQKKCAASVPEKVLDGRVDLRGKTIFTIDGDDAKDYDDAVGITKKGFGFYFMGLHCGCQSLCQTGESS